MHLTVPARFGAGASKKGLKGYLVGVLCYKNLGEALEDLLARQLSASRKRQVEAALEEQTPAWQERRHPRRSRMPEKNPSAYQQDRLARSQQLIQLHEQGMTQTAIAQQLGISLNTVRALAGQRMRLRAHAAPM